MEKLLPWFFFHLVHDCGVKREQNATERGPQLAHGPRSENLGFRLLPFLWGYM